VHKFDSNQFKDTLCAASSMTSHVVLVQSACFAAKTFVPTIDCVRARSTASGAVSSSKTCNTEVGNALTRHRIPQRDGQSLALGDARRRLKVCLTACLAVPRNSAAFVRNGAEVCVAVPRSVRFHRGRRCQAAPKSVEPSFSAEEVTGSPQNCGVFSRLRARSFYGCPSNNKEREQR
jgi:hypothetical protein